MSLAVENAAVAWHAETPAAVAAALQVVPAAGLPSAEAALRLLRYGSNRLAEKPPRPAWLKFLDQFRSLLIIVLLGAAILAGAVGDLKDALFILMVVCVNALLGFFQERRADAALAALKNMQAPTARVRRDGRIALVEAAALVPGDVLLLEAGDRVAADARVLIARSADVAEAALTGESLAVAKSGEPLAAQTILAERSNMVFMNTIVMRGRIEAVVVATGMATEMGRLAGMLAEAEAVPTPLQIQLDHLGKRLAAIAGFVVGLLLLIGLMRGDALLQTALTAIALAVAAIPEGLPAVVTVTLALGMHRMAARHAIVKRLAAVETLGCATVICSDKTGTLTLGRMAARRLFHRDRFFTVGGEGAAGAGAILAEDGLPTPDLLPLLQPAALCADSRISGGQLIGDPTEGALLALASLAGQEPEALAGRMPRIAEIPFDAAYKFMATFHRDGAQVRMWLKGAPEVLLGLASRRLGANGEAALDAAARAAFEAANTAFADNAMRVLAVAGRVIPAQDFDASGDLLAWAGDLTLLGLVGMIDPPRPEARAAIAVCNRAGIAVKMVTGDHRATAAAIAGELGLVGDTHEGSELEGLEATSLSRLVERTAVFARVAPEHKLLIVEALQARGHVVGMTGDGVNDAPALQRADIGIAMGIAGTEVAKEAAALILADDNFASIVGAVREGRTIYDNIVKFVRFQLSTNIGAILTVLGAPLFALPTPFSAIQILWVNIIMDGPPAMTLSVEPARDGIMADKPRPPDAVILGWGRLAQLCWYGFVMAAGTLGAYAWGEQHGGRAHAMTLAFTTFVLFQLFNIFNARSEHGSAFNRHFFSNGKLWLALLAVLLMQGVAVHWAPAQTAFDTTALSFNDWFWSAAIASSILLLEEARKLATRA